MPTICADSVEGAIRTTGLVSAASDFSWAGWFYVSGTPAAGTYRTFVYHGNDPATYTEYAWIGQHGAGDANAGKLELALSLSLSVFGPVLSAGWHFIVYTRSGSTHKVYRNSSLAITTTHNASGESHTHAYVGTDTYADDWDPVKVGLYKEWDVALTASEIQQQWIQPVRVRPADLWLDCPFNSDLQDISGNARHYSNSGGTLTFGTPPANHSIATAETLTLPADLTRDAAEAAFDWTYPLFFTYTPASGEVAILPFAYGEDFSNFSVRLWVYRGSDLDMVNQANLNRAWQLGLTTGEPHYFVLAPLTQATVPSDARMSFEAELFEEQPSGGRYFINNAAFDDDWPTRAFPAALLDDEQDEVVSKLFYPFPYGEAGDRLEDGAGFLFSDLRDGTLKRYTYDNATRAFTEVGSIAFDVDGQPSIRTHHSTSTFWVGQEAVPPNIRNYAFDGTLLDSFTVPATSIAGLAASNDGTILYYGWGTGNPIRRYDITNNVAFGTHLFAGLTGYTSGYDLFVLDDDTILASFPQVSGGSDFHVKRFSDDGTLLNTYSFGTVQFNPARIYWMPEDPLHFYAYTVTPTLGRSRIQKIEIATGNVVRTRVYNVMGSNGSALAASPELTARSGHDISCPLIVLPTRGGVEEGGGGGGGEEGGGGDDECVLDRPALNCWSGGTPSVQSITGTPSVQKGGTWTPTHTTESLRVGLLGS